MTFLVLGIEGQGLQTLAEAWAHHKARHDPPGMVVQYALDHEGADHQVVWHVIQLVTRDTCWWRGHPDTEAGEQAGESDARAAAWAWYERRLAVAGEVEGDPRYRIDHCNSCRAENTPQADDKCPACGEDGTLISTWGDGQAQRYRSGERYTTPDGEDDQDEGPNLWPRILTWTDEQVTEVERWLVDPAAEMPEVLSGKTAA